MADKKLRTTQKCNACAKDEDLKTCSRCKIVKYCSKDCQAQDCDSHKVRCKKIKRFTSETQRLDAALRHCWNDFDECYDNLFEKAFGRFGMSSMYDVSTKEYLHNRFSRTTEILNVAIELKDKGLFEHVCDELYEMLRLSHTDNFGFRSHIPSVFLTVGREDDCYNFIKWHLTRDDDYDWGEPPESVEGNELDFFSYL